MPVVAHQVARDEEQVEKVERAALRLHLLVAIERATQFLLEERGEVGVCRHAELIEPRAQARRAPLRHGRAARRRGTMRRDPA